MTPSPPTRHSRAVLGSAAAGESARTILVALVANIVIAVAKLVADVYLDITAYSMDTLPLDADHGYGPQ